MTDRLTSTLPLDLVSTLDTDGRTTRSYQCVPQRVTRLRLVDSCKSECNHILYRWSCQFATCNSDLRYSERGKRFFACVKAHLFNLRHLTCVTIPGLSLMRLTRQNECPRDTVLTHKNLYPFALSPAEVYQYGYYTLDLRMWAIGQIYYLYWLQYSAAPSMRLKSSVPCRYVGSVA